MRRPSTCASGVAKELVAREIHVHSAHSGGAFVALNCAAISDSLLESEIFGHEVGDLSPSAQPKLLRALEAGETLRVGGEQPTPLDVRFIAATNHPLRSMCDAGRFRTDLYYRLCVIEIRVPPLRDRVEDIVPPAEHFARLEMNATGLEFERIAPSSLPLLAAYPWRGNVREIRSVIERAIASHPAPQLEIRASEFELESDPRISLQGLFRDDWKTARERFEAAYATQLLDRHDQDVKKAAEAARLVPRSLYKMLRRLGLRPKPRAAGRPPRGP